MHGSETKVCILICTCDRPVFLDALLTGLTAQAGTQPVIIVDNGSLPSEAVVSRFGRRLNLLYDRLTTNGIVVARNRAIRLALGYTPEFLAFIDDDEVPQPGWLASLVGRLEATGADIATGPVVPEFLAPPPSWAIRGQFFFREPGFGAGNLAIRRSRLPDSPDQWFRSEFNLLGAEDEEFLKRLVADGAVYAAADAAVVREFVPPARLRRRFVWWTGFRDGVQAAQMARVQERSPLRLAGRLLAECGAKIGYGCNHLFWSAKATWRVHFAIRDVAAVAGILLSAAGMKFSFYGRRDAPAEAERGAGR